MTNSNMPGITPCLWFDNNAEEAANFYVSVFKNSKIKTIARYGEEGSEASGQTKGTVMTVSLEIGGQEFLALNGGPVFKFTEAISFIINCDTQEEVDEYWEKLTGDGGEESMCGWLKDKYGLSWQVVPVILPQLLKGGDAKRSESVMHAMLKMRKLDIKTLKEAYDQQ